MIRIIGVQLVVFIQGVLQLELQIMIILYICMALFSACHERLLPVA